MNILMYDEHGQGIHGVYGIKHDYEIKNPFHGNGIIQMQQRKIQIKKTFGE